MGRKNVNLNNARILDAVNKALYNYYPEEVDVVLNEDSRKLDVIYHSRNNSFCIESSVANEEDVDKKQLIKDLDKLGIGHCF